MAMIGMWERIRLGVVLVAAGLVAGCGGESSSAGGESSSRASTPVPQGFVFDAARLCTSVINDGLDVNTREANELAIRIFEHRRAGTRPDTAELDEWKDILGQREQYLIGAHDRLQQLRSADPVEQEAWEQVIESGPLQAVGQRARLELVETGDWDRIDAEFLGLAQGSGRQVDAAKALNLDWSDCSVVYASYEIPDDRRDLVRATTPVCNTISIRRIDQDYEDDQRVVLEAVAKAMTSTGALPAATADALRRVVAEWEATVADLESVGDDVEVPEGWQQIIDTAGERADRAERRLAAIESGDEAAIGQAFARAVPEHAGFEFKEVGIERPSCSSVRA